MMEDKIAKLKSDTERLKWETSGYRRAIEDVKKGMREDRSERGDWRGLVGLSVVGGIFCIGFICILMCVHRRKNRKIYHKQVSRTAPDDTTNTSITITDNFPPKKDYFNSRNTLQPVPLFKKK